MNKLLLKLCGHPNTTGNRAMMDNRIAAFNDLLGVAAVSVLIAVVSILAWVVV